MIKRLLITNSLDNQTSNLIQNLNEKNNYCCQDDYIIFLTEQYYEKNKKNTYKGVVGP